MVEQTKISIILKDDSVVIMSFVTNDFRGIKRDATEENINAEISRAGFDAKSWRIIQDSDIIQDRTFRNAWKDTGNELEVDMIKAREIHRNNLREKRAERLTQLDIDYLKADEAGDIVKKNKIKNEKQKLRDITIHSSIEAASTPEELKNLTLDSLLQ